MYEIAQHTADIRIHVRAQSLDRLFEDALFALMEVVYGKEEGGGDSEHISIESVDCTALLVDFLNEVLTRSHVHHRRYTAARFALLTGTALTAHLMYLPAGDFHEDVKAVTYHEANVRRDGDDWVTALVLDI